MGPGGLILPKGSYVVKNIPRFSAESLRRAGALRDRPHGGLGSITSVHDKRRAHPWATGPRGQALAALFRPFWRCSCRLKPSKWASICERKPLQLDRCYSPDVIGRPNVMLAAYWAVSMPLEWVAGDGSLSCKKFTKTTSLDVKFLKEALRFSGHTAEMGSQGPKNPRFLPMRQNLADLLQQINGKIGVLG